MELPLDIAKRFVLNFSPFEKTHEGGSICQLI